MSTASAPVIEIENARVRFGGPWVLDGVSLTLGHGETLVVFGESGSGKSTLLSLILGLLHPEGGGVRVLGEQVSHRHERELYPLRRRIGMVFQHGALFDSETVATNVGFRLIRAGMARSDVEAEVREKLAFVGLDGYEERLPGQLSGGQRKRVAIARAMVGNPPVMLYDEPTTGLDPITARKLIEVIQRIRRELGTASIIVTHELHYAYGVADRVILIRDGKIYFEGSAAEFRASRDPYIAEFRDTEAA
jgi:phospholipid/cholesterol/gamma-HCH transport system ATP-binding protein